MEFLDESVCVTYRCFNISDWSRQAAGMQLQKMKNKKVLERRHQHQARKSQWTRTLEDFHRQVQSCLFNNTRTTKWKESKTAQLHKNRSEKNYCLICLPPQNYKLFMGIITRCLLEVQQPRQPARFLRIRTSYWSTSKILRCPVSFLPIMNRLSELNAVLRALIDGDCVGIVEEVNVFYQHNTVHQPIVQSFFAKQWVTQVFELRNLGSHREWCF